MKALAVLILLAAGSPALAGLTADERAAFRAELRAYLLDHPEVIREALEGAEARRMERHVTSDLDLIAAHADELFHAPDDWTGGTPEGDVTLVSFVDYRAEGAARALDAALETAAEDGRLRLVVKDAPDPGNPEALRAARFAQAVLRLAGPDAYGTAQAGLLAAKGPLDRAALDRIAAALGLDPAAVAARMDAPDIATKLAGTQALAEALDLGPAPAQVLNRTLVRGDVPAVALSRMVEAMRRKK
ncbi:DsbA family protein [Rhodovulum sp. BSW8]|uniref:Protein-disulfide isomerase n=1 Tax=Rhodovulum visakhapatnamense TaxID=364297 RepID=A0A4R8FHD2_9RHOB|nr:MULTISPECIES: thioredoxin domain-containing protein [Rhodovulum]RBO54279.1 DsbA family protein [Rhodovulum sp. BSW8]TDX23288.1 protein-disulfide isomerase [Rhodovulum visakhapatnamense]